MCSTGPFQYRRLKGYIYNSCYYRHQIVCKYPPFPLLSYVSVVVCLTCLLHHILSLIAYTFWENLEFVFMIIVQFVMSANIWIRFALQIVLVVCTVHHHIIIIVQIIWRHCTYKTLVRYILSSVWVRLSIFSKLSIIQSIIQYVGLCVFSLPTPLVIIERINIYFVLLSSSNMKYELLPIV